MSASPGPTDAGVGVGQVHAGVGHADVVDDGDQFARRNLPPDGIVDLVAQARRLLDAGAGAGAHVQLELAGIDARERSPAPARDTAAQTSRRRATTKRIKKTRAVATASSSRP